jgi:cell division protein FtsW (lipid II flippase)
MGFNFFKDAATNEAVVKTVYSLQDLLHLLGHSLLVGIVLAGLTYITSAQMTNKKKKGPNKKRSKLILGASNILYLCVGLTAVMILVNDNLARAFSIGAAIALVRFRIKLGQKSAGSNILFGIIGGIACGLGEIRLAWLTTFIYLILSLIIMYLTRSDHTEEAEKIRIRS